MSASSQRGAYSTAGIAGAGAGTLASIVQVLVGWLIDWLFLPPGHDNNIAPRLVDRSVRKAGGRPNPVLSWLLGTGFHLGYGVSWGIAYGLLRRWSRAPVPLLTAFVTWLIYLVGFSGIGVGTHTGTEQHPDRRPWQKQVSLVAVDLTFTISLALLFDRIAQKDERRAAP